jgi:hypothetical protein
MAQSYRSPAKMGTFATLRTIREEVHFPRRPYLLQPSSERAGIAIARGTMPILHNAHVAIIEQAKLTRYCLYPGHEDGRHKARVFKSALGYELANAADLISAIRTGIMVHEAQYVGASAHGSLWCVDMIVDGPGGRATVRTGWIYEKGKDVPRLTTAYVLR